MLTCPCNYIPSHPLLCSKTGLCRSLYILPLITQQFIDQWLVDAWDESRTGNGGNKLRTYRSFKQTFKFENYCKTVFNRAHRSALAKFKKWHCSNCSRNRSLQWFCFLWSCLTGMSQTLCMIPPLITCDTGVTSPLNSTLQIGVLRLEQLAFGMSQHGIDQGVDTTNCVSETGDIVGNDICLLVSWTMDLDFPSKFGVSGLWCLFTEVKEKTAVLERSWTLKAGSKTSKFLNGNSRTSSWSTNCRF